MNPKKTLLATVSAFLACASPAIAQAWPEIFDPLVPVSYTHLRAHET